MKAAAYQSGKHLPDSDIYQTTGECPICGFAGDRPAWVNIQNDPAVQLLHCPRCRGLSSSHMPSRKALADYYDSYYADNDHEHVTLYKPDRLARRLLRGIHPGGGSSVRIMDFGGGDGSIAFKVAQHMAATTGVRVDIEVVDLVSHQPVTDGPISMRFNSDLDAAASDCDLVIASAIFEHVPDLKTMLPKVFGKMKPGGYLYARTPYMYPMIKMFRVDMTYPGHVHDLGSAFWNSIPSWFPIPLQLIRSRPAIVETGFGEKGKFFRTLAAYILKAPAYIECLYTDDPFWKLYGGWEVIFQRK